MNLEIESFNKYKQDTIYGPQSPQHGRALLEIRYPLIHLRFTECSYVSFASAKIAFRSLGGRPVSAITTTELDGS